jgi:hypothetical protein
VALVFVVAVVALVAAVACGVDEGSDEPTPAGQRTMVISQATFTPVPPNFTPEALQTRAALQTAYWQTATAQPSVAATAPPNVTMPSGPVATAAPNEIRPPDALLRTAAGEVLGSIGSFNWVSLELQAGGNISVPYVFVTESGTTLATGTSAQLVVPSSSFAVTGAGIALYNLDTNMVIPTDQSGQPIGTEPAFFPQESPVWEQRVEGANITIAPQAPPGRYILSVRVDFQTPDGLPDPLFTQYVFAVNVI